MTTKIQELRAQYPGAYDDWTDKEIADGMYNKYYSDMDRRVYDQRIGILPSDSTPGFWDTVKAGADNLSAGFSAIEAGFGELIGDEEIQQKALEEYNRKRSNASDLLTNATDWRDVVNAEDLSEGTGKFLDYTKELFGLNSPQMATIMAGGIAGATAAPLLPNPVAAAVSKVGGFGVGAALTALPVFTGFNVSRQIDEGVELNLPKAAALAVPQAAFEAAFASVLVKSGLTKAGTSVFGKSPNVPKLVAGKVSEAVAIGVPAEVFQQALERTAANLTINPFESEEAATEYLDSAIGAAVLGGGFGAISGGVQAIGIPKAVPQKTKTELESIFKEDVIQSPPPRSTLIGTPDLASQVLKNQGFDVSKFPDDLKVKAANFVLDKVEQNRMGYREKLFGVRTPEGGLLRTSTGLTPVGSLKLKIENFEPITSPDLENVKSDADIKSLAEAISPQSPFVKSDFDPLDISFTPLKLDDTSLTLEQKTAARAKYRLKKSRPKTILGGPQDEATTTLSELPGQILEDVRVQEAKRKDLLKMRKPELIQKAKEVGVPDTEINDAVSNRQRTSAQIADAIMRKSYENPEILPQPRMKPLTDVVGGPLNRVSPSPEIDIDVKTRNGVTPKTPPKRARAKAQMTEIKKALVIEPDTKFNPVSVLDQYNNTLDPLSTAEQKPVEAVMEANLFSVASKVNNSSPFINLETQLLEVFRYFTDSGLVSQKDQKVLENAVPKIEKALRTHLGLPKGAFDYFLKTPEGKKELTASYFANFVEAKRLNKKFVGVPQEVSPIFNKLHRSLLKAHTKAKSLGNLNFPAIFDNDESSANDALSSIREARLRDVADQMQKSYWKELDDTTSINWADEVVKQQSSLGKLHFLNRFVNSFVHLASVNPVAGAVYSINQTKEKIQASLLAEVNDAISGWQNTKSKEVRQRAVEVVEHLSKTGQKVIKDPNGFITFNRDNRVVQIKHPMLIKAIESFDAYGKKILDHREVYIREGIRTLLPEAYLKPTAEIRNTALKLYDKKAISSIERDKLIEFVEDLEATDRFRATAYFPRSRLGPWGFTVYRTSDLTPKGNPKPDTNPAFHAQIEEGGFMGRFNKEQYMDVQKQLEQYRNNPEFTIKGEGYAMTYNNIMSKLGNSQLTADLLMSLLGSKQGNKEYANIMRQLKLESRFKGYSRRFTKSNDIPGYSTDWDRVIANDAMAHAHYFSKQRVQPLLDSINTKVQSELGDYHQDIKDKIQNYVDYVESPHEEFQTIRSINFGWTMGLNLSTAILQVFTLPTTSLASMSQYNMNPVRNIQMLTKYFSVGLDSIRSKEAWTYQNGVLVFRPDSKEYTKRLKEKHGFSDDEIAFVEKFFKTGKSGAAMIEEASGVIRFDTRTTSGKIENSVEKFTNFIGIPISAVEQATRFATAMSHYKMFKSDPNAVIRANNILENNYAFQGQRKLSNFSLIEDLAFFGMDEAHAVFGKVARPEVLRGGLGAFIFPFMTYPQQAVEFIYRMTGRGPEGLVAAATILGSLFLMAGMYGIPGAELLKELSEEAYKLANGEEVDFEQAIRLKLDQTTGDPTAGLFVTNGIFRSLFNMDISKRVGLPIFGQDLLLAFSGVRGDMTDLAGVQGSMLTNAVEAWRAYSQDESGIKVASLLTPVAVSNLLKAYSFYDEGVVTGKGKQLLTPEEFREDPTNVIKRAIGIGSGDVATARDKRYWTILENGKYRSKMDTFRNRARNYRVKEERALQAGNQKEAQKWNQEFNNVISELEAFLSEKDIPYDMGSFYNSVEEAVVQRLTGGVQLEELNRAARARGAFEYLKNPDKTEE